jgi:hypothetical protein
LSLEARLIQGLRSTAEEIVSDPAVEPALIAVIARGDRTRRQHKLVFAMAVAALLLVAPKVGNMLVGLELDTPPTRDNRIERDLRYPDDGQDLDLGPRPPDRPGKDRAVVGHVDPQAGERTSIGAGGSSGRATGQPPAETGKPPADAHDPITTPTEPRTVSTSYSMADAAAARTGTASCDGEGSQACFRFTPQGDERFVTVTIQDRAGATVFAWLQLDKDGDGDADGEWKGFCGTSSAVPVTASTVVRVLMDVGTCDGSESLPSQGSILATFSRFI